MNPFFILFLLFCLDGLRHTQQAQKRRNGTNVSRRSLRKKIFIFNFFFIFTTVTAAPPVHGVYGVAVVKML